MSQDLFYQQQGTARQAIGAGTRGRALRFGEAVVATPSRTLFAEGPARFKVLATRLGRFGGSEKLEPGPKFVVTMQVVDRDDVVGTVERDIIINEVLVPLITGFLRSTGVLGEDDQELVITEDMFRATIGCEGVCIIAHNEGRGGRVFADVDRFVYGAEAEQALAQIDNQ